MPGEISEYLRHIGPVRDPFGVTWLPELDVYFEGDNIEGLGGGGPNLYDGGIERWETYPLPLIAFLKANADLNIPPTLSIQYAGTCQRQ